MVTRVLKDNVVLGLGGSVVMVIRDGTRIPIDEIATPTRDKAGQINGVVLVLRSIPKPEPETREQILSQSTLTGYSRRDPIPLTDGWRPPND